MTLFVRPALQTRALARFTRVRYSSTSPLSGADSATKSQHPSTGKQRSNSASTSPSEASTAHSAQQDSNDAQGAKSREQEMMNSTHYGSAAPKEGVATKGSKLEQDRRQAGQQGE
ncbi:hypothetical protein OIO90_006280 [Microbotryomycetes sp. JL221]|nr:hypothetical protein OIO90_006280 [Microbotryomycetes sp. JL221]